jgi:hypothetical protein
MFLAAEREALAAMLVVRANAAREVARVAAEEEAARAAEAALDLAAREEAAAAKEVSREAARAVARAEEQAEEAAAEAAAQEEMARDRRHWDEDMAAADASARSTSSPPIAATAGTWLAAKLSAPARPATRAPTPSTWAGATTCCRRRQDEDGGAVTKCWVGYGSSSL